MALPIPKAFIDSLLTQCDIVALINQSVPLDHFSLSRKQGSNYVIRCPFHQESTPSFTISTHKQIYHCFGCGVGGNALSFVMAYHKLEFLAAVEWLANHLQVPLPERTHEKSAAFGTLEKLYSAMADAVFFYQSQLHNNPEAIAYLKQRGITKSSIQQFNIGFAPSNWNHLYQFLTRQKQHNETLLKTAGLIHQKNNTCYDRFRSRIIFPIRDKQGRYIGLGGRIIHSTETPKYLNSPETPIFHKSKALYGLYENQLGNTSPVWVVEGYLDVITLHQFNIRPVVATLGTSINVFHLQQLFRYTKEVIFCFDGDAPGQRAALKALELSLANIQDDWTIKFLILPEGEDPDSWIRQPAQRSSDYLLEQAILLEDFLFMHVKAGLSLHTDQGKRQLLNKAMPLLQRTSQGIYREQLFQRLARLTSTDANKLQQLNHQHSYANQRSFTHPSNKKYTVLDRAIGLLLQYPQELSSVPLPAMSHRIKSNYPVFNKLIEQIHAIDYPNTASLLEQFRNQSFPVPNLMELAQYDWLIPPEGVIDEFQDILIHLEKISRDQEISQLMQKNREHRLAKHEQEHLTTLLKERNNTTLSVD